MKLIVNAKPTGTELAAGEVDQTAEIFEGNWYFDPAVVDMSRLKVTERTYTCPYKGTCYWIDLQTPTGSVPNVGWVYNNPKPGYENIKDQIGFYARDTAGTSAKRSE